MSKVQWLAKFSKVLGCYAMQWSLTFVTSAQTSPIRPVTSTRSPNIHIHVQMQTKKYSLFVILNKNNTAI